MNPKLVATMLLGLIFLGIKFTEYYLHYPSSSVIWVCPGAMPRTRRSHIAGLADGAGTIAV